MGIHEMIKRLKPVIEIEENLQYLKQLKGYVQEILKNLSKPLDKKGKNKTGTH